MNRIPHPEEKAIQTVSQADYLEDMKRGYCITEFRAESEMVLRDRRLPGKEIRQKIPAVYCFRCMLCQYDVVDGDYAPDKFGNVRKGIDIIREHVMRGNHPWRYNPFNNPYGHVSEVVIEGIDDYAATLAAKEGA